MADFRIPKQTDRDLVMALAAIRDEMRELINLNIQVVVHDNGPTVLVRDEESDKDPSIDFVLAEQSQIMPQLRLLEKGTNACALLINRTPADITDRVTATDNNWNTHIQQRHATNRSQICIKLIALARKHLKAPDAEASLFGGSDTEWTRFRNSQQIILNSLQTTQKNILEEFTRKSLEVEANAKEKYDTLERNLKQKTESIAETLSSEHKARMDELDSREHALKEREESFNTKEARYVARKEQQNQIEQIKRWLEGWSLTKGTTGKRRPVIYIYIAGLIVTGFLAFFYSLQTFQILKIASPSNVTWWEWALLTLKSVVPAGAFITFIIYFIRWSISWARQHAEEEFRNRTRLLDIGRSAWLLEAVRDAQDNGKELPSELLRQLSQNLFAPSLLVDSEDIHPHALSDLIMQRVGSLSLKTPGGLELEASREKKRK